MPRRPSAPSYRLHRPSKQAVVTIAGKDYYLGPHGSEESVAKYKQLLAEWARLGQAAEPLGGKPPPDLTVAEAVDRYLAWARTYYVLRDDERGGYIDRVRNALGAAVELYGPTEARSFGPLALKAVRQTLVSRNLCRKEINARVDAIKRAWKWLVSEELVPVTAYEALRTVAGLRAGKTEARESEPVRPAPEESIAKVKTAVLLAVRDMIDLQLLSGCRPGEVVLLRPQDVDRTGDVWIYRPHRHKTKHRGRDRFILFGPQAQAILAPYLLRDQDAYCFSPAEAMEKYRRWQRQRRQTPVQPSQEDRSKAGPRKSPGERYTTQSYNRAVRAACDRIGIEPWHVHQLRHNAATRLVRDFGWDVARIILGHRTLSATRIYGEDDQRKAKEVILKVG